MFQQFKNWVDNQLAALNLQNSKMSKLNRYIIIAGLSIWCILFIGGLIQFSGSKLIYFIFSFVFLVLLISGFIQQDSYGYLFLSILLWLGFWLKLILHLIFGYTYVEPIGAFTGTSAAWNEVLWVATVAAIGIIMGRVIYRICFHKNLGGMMQHNLVKVPSWYPSSRKWLWVLILIIIIGLCIFNSIYGIEQIGLISRTILPVWPSNAIVYFLLNIGLTGVLSIFLWWDISLKKNVFLPLHIILIEGTLVGISILSRATYILHIIPQLIAIYKNQKFLTKITLARIAYVLIIFIFFFLISQTVVKKTRENLYLDSAPLSNKIQVARIQMKSTFNAHVNTGVYKTILQLAVDRWIGLEGVMSVQAYPQKGMSLFLKGIEGASYNTGTIYQNISNCSYSKVSDKFSFGAGAGFIALLYYSGSYGIILLGGIMISMFMLLIERLFSMLTSNPIFCSLIGLYMSYNIAQSGGGVYTSFKAFIFILLTGIFVRFIQSSHWTLNYKFLPNLKTHISSIKKNIN